VKVDWNLLNSFTDLNSLALSRFPPEELGRIGVYSCPGNDLDSKPSTGVDYAELLPGLFELEVRDRFVRTRKELVVVPGRHFIFN